MNFNIKTKLSISFGAILLLFLFIVTMNHFSISKSNAGVAHIKNIVNEQVQYSNDIKVSVIQVQQFLTDAALTNSKDSIDKAEQYKGSFKTSIQKFKELNPDMADKINQIDKEFDSFYDIGLQMENSYSSEGTEKGNILMEQFDPASESITKSVDDLVALSNTAMEKDLNSINQEMRISEIVGTSVSIVVMICIVIIVMLLGRNIVLPINKLLSILVDLESGEGDLTKRIDLKTKDEIGRMALAFNKFMDNLEKMILNIKENAEVVSKGSKQLSSGEGKTSEGINIISEHMAKVNSDTMNISDSISKIAESIADVAVSSEGMAIDVQNISASAEDINTVVIESGKIAMEAKLEMEEIEKISTNTLAITEQLGSEAQEIGNIIDTIKKITDKTNLLALNAAIEAASAGEHDRGFGVVADEIRKLAESNSYSAKNIESLIKNIQMLITKTIDATNSTGQSIKTGSKMVDEVYFQLNHIIKGLSDINNKIQNIVSITEEQSASTDALSGTMQAIKNSNAQIVAAVQEITSNISGQADTTAELSSIAEDLNVSAEQMDKLVNKFKLDI